jgi:hypothetical protein
LQVGQVTACSEQLPPPAHSLSLEQRAVQRRPSTAPDLRIHMQTSPVVQSGSELQASGSPPQDATRRRKAAQIIERALIVGTSERTECKLRSTPQDGVEEIKRQRLKGVSCW